MQFVSQMAPEYEIEPISFQASAMSYIPNEIASKDIQQSGVLVDNICYFIVQNSLYLWRTGELNQGIAMPKRDHHRSQFQKFDFAQPIQKVCYIENYQTRFTPYLVVATKEEIKLMEFKSVENSSVISKHNFDLIQLKESDFNPVILDLDEVITCITQHQKTGRIFYSSHCESYTSVKIKELNMGAMQGVMNNLMESIGKLAIGTFGINLGLNNKRLKSVITDDQSQNIAS
jgi:hypothetical protein